MLHVGSWHCVPCMLLRLLSVCSMIGFDTDNRLGTRFITLPFQIMTHEQIIFLFRYAWDGINKLNYTVLSREVHKQFTILHVRLGMGIIVDYDIYQKGSSRHMSKSILFVK